MSSTLGKTILKWTILTLPWVLALLLAVGWGVTTWTPGYLDKLIPELAKETGIPLEEFHIRDAGFFSADIGPVRLGSEDDGLTITNVHLTYTPALLKEGRVASITIDGIKLHLKYDGQSLTFPTLQLLPSSESTGNDDSLPALPFTSLHINNAKLVCLIEGQRITLPFEASIIPDEALRFSGDVTIRDQRLDVAGSLGPSSNDLQLTLDSKDFQLGAINDVLPTPVTGSATMNLVLAMDLSSPESVSAQIKATLAGIHIPDSGFTFSDTTPIEFQAELDNQSVTFSTSPIQVLSPHPLTLTVSDGHLSRTEAKADFTMTTSGITLPGSLSASQVDESWDIELTSGSAERLAIATGGRTIRLAGFNGSVKGKASAASASLTVAASTRGVSLDGTPIKAGSTSFTLPLAWPAPKQHTRGKLRISNLRYDTYKLGTLSARIRQEGMGLGLGGALYSQLLPDLTIQISGKASTESREATFQFDLPAYTLPANYDPSTFLPDLSNVKLNGVVTAEGGINIEDGDIDSRLGVFFTQGTLEAGEEGSTVMDGIQLYFESPDIINFRSAPAQFVSFKSISAGPITLGQGSVTYQLEPGGILLVERLGFDWAGGQVATRAFRIVPGHDEYDLTLFCSELRLSSILQQLGLANAKGQAALSGTLPVQWKNGKISFNNGFLHSTPGQGGSIQVEAMDDLVSAIPQGTPQRGQLELAQAAIKDFEYKWVRIKADTVGDELMVRLSLDGKPVGTLPFVYKKEFGGFARVTGDVKGSNFQGLRLDVNFNLPMDRILLYKDIINMME